MRVLLVDTCGDRAGVALAQGEMCGHVELPARAASAEILTAIRQMLAEAEWTLPMLDGVGVVTGPGSFTGVRAGLAAAKGLCEALGLPLVGISRLAVLADAAGPRAGVAALDAGRGNLYVRDAESGREWLTSVEESLQLLAGRRVVVAEERVAEALRGVLPELREIRAIDAHPLAIALLKAGGSDAASVDANYVREEQSIYGSALPSSAETRRP